MTFLGKKAAGFQDEICPGGEEEGSSTSTRGEKQKAAQSKSDHIDSLQYDKEYSRERFYCLLRLFGGKSSSEGSTSPGSHAQKKKRRTGAFL